MAPKNNNNKNRFSPLLVSKDTDNIHSDNTKTDILNMRQKIRSLFVYNITNFIFFFCKTITSMLIEEFNIMNKNTCLRLNFTHQLMTTVLS